VVHNRFKTDPDHADAVPLLDTVATTFHARTKGNTFNKIMMAFLLIALGRNRIRRVEKWSQTSTHSEPEPAYLEDAFALLTVCKWHARFRDGKTELSDDPRSVRPGKSDLAESIPSMLKERAFSSCDLLTRHFRVAKATWLQVLH
jgi:hypothetical protein